MTQLELAYSKNKYNIEFYLELNNRTISGFEYESYGEKTVYHLKQIKKIFEKFEYKLANGETNFSYRWDNQDNVFVEIYLQNGKIGMTCESKDAGLSYLTIPIIDIEKVLNNLTNIIKTINMHIIELEN